LEVLKKDGNLRNGEQEVVYKLVCKVSKDLLGSIIG